MILQAPNKLCDLDPIPTPLLKSCTDVLVTPITSLVNMSLFNEDMPTSLKTTYVSPLLKKPSLSKEEMKNYRPVSNLSFISKIIEKVVATRLHAHLLLSKTSNPD